MKTLLRFSKTKLAAKTFLPILITACCLNNVTAMGAGGAKPGKGNLPARLKTKTAVAAKAKTDQLSGPTVSYTTPHSYLAGQAVSLTPTSSGVAAAAFAGTPALVYSGETPYGIAVDGAGNVYMAAPFNSAILEIPAGGGTPVSVGSGFLDPTGVAVDDRGDVYVADAGHNAVKVVSAGGTNTVGTGFSSPTGVSIDADGNIYVADFGNNAVKEILSGNGSTVVLATGLNEPYMVATDGAGNIYATEAGNNQVVKIPKGGGTPVAIGSGYSNPEGIGVDGSGNVYVCNKQSNVVEMIPAGGGSSVTLGSGFSSPIGLSIDPSGDVYVADGGNNAIKEIKPVGGYYISPLLPAGLTLNNTTGVISGMVASNTSATDYTVTAYNSSGNASAVVNIQTTILDISYASPQVFTAGTPIGTQSPTETNVAAIAYNNAVPASATGYNLPGELAVDPSGNVYVADANNNDIKEITPAGVVTTLGSGLSHPQGVAVDFSNNVYVADYGNNAIKEIPAGGGTTKTLLSGLSHPTQLTIDGSGNIYFLQLGLPSINELPAGGTSYVLLSAAFDSPVSIASDLWGNVYVADVASTGIYRIAASGGLPQDLVSVANPTAVAVDASGNVYYADHSSNSIHMLNGTNTPILVSGAFSDPVGVAVDASGNVYGADDTGNSVQKITPAGGYFINNPLPQGLSFNSSIGAITGTPVAATFFALNYIVTAYNAYGSNSALINIKSSLPAAPAISYSTPKSFDINTAITPLTPTGSGVSPLTYSSTATALGSGFAQPQAVATDATGNLYIAAYNNGGIYKIAAGGSTPVSIGLVSTPDGIAVDAAGNVYVSSWDNNAIYKIPAGGGSPVSFASGFDGPAGLAFDPSGNLFEADYNSGNIYEIPAGSNSSKGICASGFSRPNAVATDAAGNVYVADPGGPAIMKITLVGGVITTILAGTGSGIWDPYGIAVDASGNIFIAQRIINTVQEIPHGTATLIPLGSGFIYPYGVAVDGTGNVFVANYGLNAVNEVKPLGSYYLAKALPAGLNFNNATGAISGTPTTLTAAANYTITGYNPGGSTAATVNIAIVSPDATLSALKLITATLSPAFASGTINYTSTVPNATDNISVQSTTNFTGATMELNGYAFPDNSVSDPINLSVGKNTITLTVTAEDGVTTKTYTINVTRAAPPNANLSALKLSAGTLSPGFSASTTSYTASVGNGVASVTVTPTAGVSTSTIKVDGTAVTSGTASTAIPLLVGPNTITAVVTAQDGVTTKTYTVVVTRAPSSNASLSTLGQSVGGLTPAFSAGTTSYTESVSYTNTTMTLKPVSSDPNATIKVNGTAVTSGTMTAPIALSTGPNAITTVVTAQDGTTTKTYTLTVTRLLSAIASLSNLKLSTGTLTPAFATATTSYTVSVANSVTTMTVTPTTTDANATVKVNGTTVTSGTASAAISLAEGAQTAINTVVTAQNGTTKETYTVTVTRAPSANANLSTLGQSVGGLTPSFSSATISYTENVSNATATMTLKPVSSDAHATIKANGTAVTSGTATNPIALAVGANTITTVVTSQNGTTTKTYTLTVTRASGGVDEYDPGISVTKPTETPILANDGIQVHQGVSPNGDGINDFLQIDNISQYPENKLMIMNRNGQLVYEANGYDNSSKVFDGHSNKNGQMQLPGTYFYQLDYTANGIVKHKTGFLVLKY